jgi:hypothetical protein
MDHTFARVRRTAAARRQFSIGCPDSIGVDVDDVVEHEIIVQEARSADK